MNHKTAVSTLVLGVIVSALTIAQPQTERMIRVAPFALRLQARTVVLPVYPQSSFAAGTTGKAVVQVVFSKEGKVKSVENLESPDAAIAASVKAAVERWEFTPPVLRGTQDAVGMRGNLVFRFYISGGKPQVEDTIGVENAEAEKRKKAGQ
jgi:TonB family protein